MPNRIIKDSIHTSDTCNSMTDFQFRLWVSLITYVDDYGRGDARPAIIKGTCFPLRERLTNKEIEAGLTGLAGLGCIGLYEVDGRSYLYFPTWEKHQSIRNKKSKFPAPEDGLQKLEINCNQLQANVPVIQSESESISESESEEPPKPPRGTRTRFQPPTVEEVAEFIQGNGYIVSAQRFVNYYASNGWKVGKNPMKDWKAAVRTWENKEREERRNDRGHTGAAASGNTGRAWNIQSITDDC